MDIYTEVIYRLAT